MVSIIMPSYNSSAFIGESIKSVLAQTYNDWELIVVDDKSMDNSVEVVEEFCRIDERIKLIELEVNSGAAVARNVAIQAAKGRFIAFLDSDDLWDKDKLSAQVNFMKNHQIDCSCTYYRKYVYKEDMTTSITDIPRKINYSKLLRGNIIGCLTVIYDTKNIGKCLMPTIRKRQDYALWLSILKKIDFIYCLDKPLATYRVREDSISANKLGLLKYNWRLFREVEGFSIFKSFYYLTFNILNRVFTGIKNGV